MALLLAPFTHAMRIGQGFNSYSQQICIDDAVVIDDQRPENVVTNDGTTMRIMAQKSGTPSAWTRQKEVIGVQTATAVLEQNAIKAKAEVAVIEAALADDSAEELSSNSEPASEPNSKSSEGQLNADPPKPEHEAFEDESGSIDEIADADEARKLDNVSVTEKGGDQELQTASAGSETESAKPINTTEKPTKSEGDDDEVDQRAILDNIQANASKDVQIDRAAITANLQANAQKPKRNTDKPTKPKGDDDEVDQEGMLDNIQANASKEDQVDREAIIANLQANAQKPSASQKKPLKRGASSDRGRKGSEKALAGPLDRASIRAALTGKAAPDAAKSAKEEAEQAKRQQEESEILAEQRRYQKEILKQQRQDEADRRKEEREELCAVRAEKRAWDAKRREDARKAIENAANLKATSLADLEKIRAQNQFVERFNGMSEQTQKYDFDATAPRGPSQTVMYTSRFVDRLSDVLDDMSVSGSLSIKAGKVGGSGKGSFVDSDKFKESDLNFYISVKVVNQTINFKDALVFNPLRSVGENNFREVYGDSFISGFIEGGEFNAIVSMKILNKAKKTDIQAEAKIALTAGTVQIEAEANVGIARSNIETNTETTIQVFWSGGGHIKPMEQQWDIQSLMAAAARFPDLVAECPQRTYAILTKYAALRSFVARSPASYTPLQYENAQIYTNTLLDAFVSYKSLYKCLGEKIFGVQGKTLEVVPWSDTEKVKVAPNSTAVSRMGSKDKDTGLYPYVEYNSNFEASIKGLSDARTAVRRQMARIVNEVDAIEKDPKLATDEDHAEPFQSPVAFEARIPVVEIPERLRVKSNPLSGKRIAAKPLSEEEQKKQIAEEERLAEGKPLYMSSDKLEADEQKAFDTVLGANPVLGAHFQVSSAAGDSSKGEWFNNLEFLKPDWMIRSIRTEMFQGALVYLAVSYSNGLLVEKGASRDKTRIKKFNDFLPGERINSAAVEYGNEKGKDLMPTQVLGLRLFTNRGRALVARALKSTPGENGVVVKDDVTYEKVSVHYMDVPFSSGTLKGFFGRSDDSSAGKIFRLGLIWARMPQMTEQEAEAQFVATSDTVDSEDFALLQKDQTTGSKALQEMQQKLSAAQKEISEFEKIRNSKPFGEAQYGSFTARDMGWRAGENSFARCSVKFPRSYAAPPKVLFGLSFIDAEANKNRALSLAFPEVKTDAFSLQVASWSGCTGHEIGCSWMTLPDDLHLETGMLHTYNTPQSDFDTFTQHVFFSQSFTTPPKVCVWIQEFEWQNRDFMSMRCNATDINCYSFNLKIESWAGRRFKNARVQFLAYPSEEDGKRVKSGKNVVQRAEKSFSSRSPFYGEPFKNTPKTFIAMAGTDFGCDKNTRFRCAANAPNNKELEWSFGTWDDTNMDHAEVQWIALE